MGWAGGCGGGRSFSYRRCSHTLVTISLFRVSDNTVDKGLNTLFTLSGSILTGEQENGENLPGPWIKQIFECRLYKSKGKASFEEQMIFKWPLPG